MKIYQDLLQEILEDGVSRPDRTGVGSIFIPGAHLNFDLRDGFPAMTTRPLPIKNIIGEIIGFLRGYTNAADFRSIGCNFWNKNANEDGIRPNQWLLNPNRRGTDDLGRIYGKQWREWRGKVDSVNATFSSIENGLIPNVDYVVRHQSIDQVWSVLNTLRNNPNDRRMIVNAWRPDEFGEMALPPCHVLHHYLVDTENKVLHMNMFQRSVDSMLGLPANIAEYAVLLHIMARLTGYTAGRLGLFLSDVHIYLDHQDAACEQIERKPFDKPFIFLDEKISPKLLEDFPQEGEFDVFNGFSHLDISLVDYKHHPGLTNATPMHV